MRAVFVIVLFLNSLMCYSQYDQKSERAFVANTWPVGKVKNLYGHNILRVSGSGGFTAKGITNIKFIDQDLLLATAEHDAQAQMWTPEQIQQKRDFYESISGLLWLRIVRMGSLEAANPKHFTLIIVDSNGEEFYRASFDEDIADYEVVSGGVVYFNNAVRTVPKGLSPPFNVFIIDALSEPTRHEFRVLN